MANSAKSRDFHYYALMSAITYAMFHVFDLKENGYEDVLGLMASIFISFNVTELIHQNTKYEDDEEENEEP